MISSKVNRWAFFLGALLAIVDRAGQRPRMSAGLFTSRWRDFPGPLLPVPAQQRVGCRLAVLVNGDQARYMRRVGRDLCPVWTVEKCLRP